LFGHIACMQLNVVVGKVAILPKAMRSQVQFSAQRPAILTAFMVVLSPLQGYLTLY